MTNLADQDLADITLKTIENVCRDFEGHGISSVGACASLKAMAHHWKDHLYEGHKPRIISDDIDELKNLLEIMRAEILRRVVEQTAPNTRDQRQIYETGNDDTGWNAKVLANGVAFEVQVFDADGERRPEGEEPFTDKALAIAYADKVVLRKAASNAALETNRHTEQSQLFTNGSGHLVEVLWTSTATVVEYAPRGGGVVRKCARSDFEREYKPAALPVFELVAITADWLPADAKVEAYANGLRWNGWAMPYFTEKAAHSLLQLMPDLRYDSARDAFISKAHDSDEEESVFPAENLLVGGTLVKTYAIGAGSWCWELCD